MALSDIILAVQRDIKGLYIANKLSLYKGKVPSECMIFFALPVIKDMACNLLFLSWTSPPIQWHKLNIDGACKGNPGDSGAGGIIPTLV